jgi:heme/copper-type cytochrome/quinol oxidase subunit 2
VANKRRRKTSWLRNLLLFIFTFIFTPLIIWFLAFLIWFYWNDITGQDKTPPTKASKQMDKRSDKTAQERIGEEDRRKLEEILKSKK